VVALKDWIVLYNNESFGEHHILSFEVEGIISATFVLFLFII